MFILINIAHTIFGDNMNLLEYILMPIFSLIVLFILTKLMGYRQVSQLNMYDYIIGITVGSVASEFIMMGYDDYLRPLIAMIVYAIFTILTSFISRISLKARGFIDGNPIILFENNQIYNEQLDKAKIDLDEFLMQCRTNGYFDLKQLDTIVLETNGKFSFLPKEKYRPVQFDDLNKDIQNTTIPTVLVKQGTIYIQNLKKVHRDRAWLDQYLREKNINLNDIILMLQEDNSNIQLYTNNKIERSFH